MATKTISRGQVLKGSGALVVSFSFFGPLTRALGQAVARAPGEPDATNLDSWLAVSNRNSHRGSNAASHRAAKCLPCCLQLAPTSLSAAPVPWPRLLTRGRASSTCIIVFSTRAIGPRRNTSASGTKIERHGWQADGRFETGRPSTPWSRTRFHALLQSMDSCCL